MRIDELTIFKCNLIYGSKLIHLWKFSNLIEAIISTTRYFSNEIWRGLNWYIDQSSWFKLMSLLV